MSRFLACITDCDKTSIADKTYAFIQQEGELPSDEEIYNIIKNSYSLDEAFHDINICFANKTKEALLNALSMSQRQDIGEHLKIEFKINADDPADDSCEFSLGSYVLDEIDTEKLLNFHAYLENIEKNILLKKMNVQYSLTLDIKKNTSDSILQILEEGVYLPVIDSSCGTHETIILELSLLRELAETNEDVDNKLEKLYSVLAESQVDLYIVLEKFQPQVLVLEVDLE